MKKQDDENKKLKLYQAKVKIINLKSAERAAQEIIKRIMRK